MRIGLIALAMLLACTAPAAHAAVETALYATGVHDGAGSIVDPAGRIWVSHGTAGLCRITDPTVAGPGSVEASTCVGPTAPGAPAFHDPTPASPGSGDERVFVPDASAASSAVIVLGWHPDTGLFTATGTVTMDADPALRDRSSPVATSAGADGFVYVGFRSSGTLQRFDPAAAVPRAELVARTADGGGVSALAAGYDSAGAPAIYVAERGGVRRFRPDGVSGSQPSGLDLGAASALTYDLARHILYAGAPGGLVQRAFTDSGAVETYATGFSTPTGLAVRPDGAVLIADGDPSGRLSIAGLPTARITAGPLLDDGSPSADPEFTNDATPTFTVAGDQTLHCSLVAAGAGPVWHACPGGTATAAAPLTDGRYVFATRAQTATSAGVPAAVAFTVDTSPPAAPIVAAPLDASTVTGSPAFDFGAEPGAALSCSLDDGPYAACAPGATFAFTADGRHSLRVRAADRAGNVSAPSGPSRFTVDVTAPTVTITAPAENGVTGRAPDFSYHASEPGVTYRCRIDLGHVVPCGTDHRYANLPPGPHRFQVGATDAIGHVGPMTVRRFRVGAAPEGSEEITGEGAGGDGTTAGSPPSALGEALSMRARVSRAHLARHGLRIAFTPRKGTSVVRIRVFRLTTKGAALRVTTFRAVKGTARRVLVLRDRAIRRLPPGRYRLALAAGPSRRRLAPATERGFRILA